MSEDKFKEYYFDRCMKVPNIKPELIKWLSKNSFVIKNTEQFLYDIQDQLFDFSIKIGHYNESKNAIANHHKKNYIEELEQAIDDLTSIENMITDLNNPLFDNSKNDYKVLKKIQKCNLLLLNKLINEQEKHEFSINTSFINLLNKETNTSLSIVENNITKFNAYKTKNRSELRLLFIASIAYVFMNSTGRNTLKRTSEDLSGEKTNSPFQELVEICFKVIDERVGIDSLKKLLAQVNK